MTFFINLIHQIYSVGDIPYFTDKLYYIRTSIHGGGVKHININTDRHGLYTDVNQIIIQL
jgi:hypothetical protein